MKEKILLIFFGVIFGLITSEIVARLYFFYDEKIAQPKKVNFKKKENQDQYRIAILGESTSRGFPYNMVDVYHRENYDFYLPTFSKIMLEKYFGYKDIKIDPYCEGGWTIKQSVNYYFKKAEYKPDLIIIIAGFNEIPCYYSPNMDEIPEFLLPFAKFKIGELLLRAIFIKPVVEDTRYKGDFFSKKILPDFEKKRINDRYEKYLNRVIKHSKKENIPLIIIAPDGNYLFPPTRSIYQGEKDKKSLALKLFKEAFYYRYFENNLSKAKEILLKIKEFADFSDLYYELGSLFYLEKKYDQAKEYLRKSIDLDGYSFTPSSELRDICKNSAKKEGIPFIDMHNIVTVNLKTAIPDYTYYIDNAHLKLEAYFELNREIINQIKENNFLDFKKHKEYTIDKIMFIDVVKELNIPSDMDKRISYNTLEWLDEQSNYFFLKYRFFLKMVELKKIVANSEVFPDIEERLKKEEEKILNWIKQDVRISK